MKRNSSGKYGIWLELFVVVVFIYEPIIDNVATSSSSAEALFNGIKLTVCS